MKSKMTSPLIVKRNIEIWKPIIGKIINRVRWNHI